MQSRPAGARLGDAWLGHALPFLGVYGAWLAWCNALTRVPPILAKMFRPGRRLLSMGKNSSNLEGVLTQAGRYVLDCIIPTTSTYQSADFGKMRQKLLKSLVNQGLSNVDGQSALHARFYLLKSGALTFQPRPELVGLGSGGIARLQLCGFTRTLEEKRQHFLEDLADLALVLLDPLDQQRRLDQVTANEIPTAVLQNVDGRASKLARGVLSARVESHHKRPGLRISQDRFAETAVTPLLASMPADANKLLRSLKGEAPVELGLWEPGKHSPGFHDFARAPDRDLYGGLGLAFRVRDGRDGKWHPLPLQVLHQTTAAAQKSPPPATPRRPRSMGQVDGCVLGYATLRRFSPSHVGPRPRSARPRSIPHYGAKFQGHVPAPPRQSLLQADPSGKGNRGNLRNRFTRPRIQNRVRQGEEAKCYSSRDEAGPW
ncbi:hypothetical protein V8E36_009777 [Tilletia maclaganii]